MKLFRRAVLPLIIALTAISPVFAQSLYITNEPQESLELLNIKTKQISTLFHLPGKPDDLVLNSNGQLIYSIPNLGTVYLYDPIKGVNSVLVSGVTEPWDLCIEPGGQTMLIADHTLGQIVRFNFSTGVTTILTKKLVTVDGIAYDGYGNLYAVANHNTIVRVNPVTGAVLQTLVLEPHHAVNGGDGMTYDPYTGQLWISHNGTLGFGVEEIFTNAAGFTGTFELYPTPPGIHALDGIKSDGNGNLYIGAAWTVGIYNIPTQTLTQNIVVKGADGVSLVPGTY
jgi:hypothetical protein